MCKIEKEEIEEEGLTDDNYCIICVENERNCLFLPCQHSCACIKCSKGLKNCPICRV